MNALNFIRQRLYIHRQGLAVYWLIFLCLVFAPWQSQWTALMRFEAAAIFEGQWWRFFTGQWVHESWIHLGLNSVGVLVLQQLFGPWLQGRDWFGCTVFCALLISLGLLFFSHYDYYVGVSAIIHGLFIFAALHCFKQDRLLCSATLAVLIIKTINEQFVGATDINAALIGIPIATDSHLYGLIGGTLYWVLNVIWRQLKVKSSLPSQYFSKTEQ